MKKIILSILILGSVLVSSALPSEAMQPNQKNSANQDLPKWLESFESSRSESFFESEEFTPLFRDSFSFNQLSRK